MNKEIIRIERKILKYCLRRINRNDLVDSLDSFSDNEIHDMYLKICKIYKGSDK